MGLVYLLFRQIMSFMLVASFSIFFMQLFFIGGILSAKIQRNVSDMDDMKNLRGYMGASFGGLIGGTISLIVIVFL